MCLSVKPVFKYAVDQLPRLTQWTETQNILHPQQMHVRNNAFRTDEFLLT